MYSYCVEISPEFAPLIARYLDGHKGESFDDLIATALQHFLKEQLEGAIAPDENLVTVE